MTLSANIVIVVLDTSIRNNVATFITHIYSYSNPVKKTLHHAVNGTMTEAKLFAIRCGINQTIQITNVTHIIVITDFIHSVHYIFDPFIHSYQQQSIAMLENLRLFFNKHPSNIIKFWDYPSNTK